VPIDTGTARFIPDPPGGPGVLLEINGAPSSHLDLRDPTQLLFEYMQWARAAIVQHVPPDQRLAALHLGAAGCALPRALDAQYPDATQIAVELDGELARLAREWFPLPRSPRLRLRVAEAGEALAARPAGSHNVIVRDVFGERAVPPHLMTDGFVRHCARVLAPGGIYLANCAGTTTLEQARRELVTAARAFDHVAVIAEPGQFRGRRWGNVVILAGGRDAEETTNGLARRLRSLPIPARIVAGSEAVGWAGRAKPLE
jgi:spermidine synthase